MAYLCLKSLTGKSPSIQEQISGFVSSAVCLRPKRDPSERCYHTSPPRVHWRHLSLQETQVVEQHSWDEKCYFGNDYNGMNYDMKSPRITYELPLGHFVLDVRGSKIY